VGYLEPEVTIELNGILVVLAHIEVQPGHALFFEGHLEVLDENSAKPLPLGAGEKINVQVGGERGHNLFRGARGVVNERDDRAVPRVTAKARVLGSKWRPPVGGLPLPESVGISGGKQVTGDAQFIDDTAGKLW
jgi:hypothetical protein